MKTVSCLVLFLIGSITLRAQPVLKPDTLWRFTIGRYSMSEPIIDNGVIYVGGEKQVLYAVDAKTGTEKWQLKVSSAKARGGIYHSIRADDKNLYFNDGSSNFRAVSKSNGKIIWEFGSCRFDDDYWTSILLYRELVVFNSLDSSVIALDRSSGKEKWRYSDKGVVSGIVLHEKSILFFSANGKLIALNADKGSIDWAIDMPFSGMPALPPRVANGHLLVTNDSGRLCCVSLGSRKIVWESRSLTPFIFDSPTGFLLPSDSGLVQLDPATGKENWRIPGEHMWYIAPFYFNKKLYYYSRKQDKLYCIDEKTGKVEHLIALRGKTYTRPLADEERIYLGISDKYFAIRRPE